MVLNSHLLELRALEELKKYKELYGPLKTYVSNNAVMEPPMEPLTEAHVNQLLEQHRAQKSNPNISDLLTKSLYHLQTDILKQFPYYLFWKNLDSVYCGCNDNFARQVGLKKAEDIIGKTDYELDISSEKASKSKMEDQQVITSGIPLFDIEEDNRGEDSVLYVKKLPLKDPNGRIIGVLGFCWYRTDRQMDLKKLAENEARLDAFLDYSSGVIIEINEDDKIVYINPSASRILGYSQDDLIGQYIGKIAHPEDLLALEDLLTQRNQKNRQVIRFKHINQSYLDIELLIAGAKKSRNSILISHNVTGDKQAERALKARIENLEQKLLEQKAVQQQTINMLRNFMAHVRHDFGGAITRQKSFLTQIQKRVVPKFNTEENEFFQYVVDGSKILGEMLEGIVEYSKLTTKKINYRKVNLDEVLVAVKNGLKLLVDESEATIEIDPLPTLIASNGQMNQLFDNLIHNAIKYRRSNITPHIKITVEPQKDSYLFCIEDNGIGVEKDSEDTIFELFERLEYNDAPGCGVGLAICRQVVANHQGKIWCESTYGEGTKMYFTLTSLLVKNI